METYINSRGCLGRLLGMPWRPAASEVIVALDTEITETQRFLRETTVRPGRRSIDHTLARYLWFGAQTAEVISLACKAGHPAGTATLRRFLFETLLDIHLLVSSKSPALDAARSMAWGVLDWGRVWERHDEAAAEHPHLDARRAPAQSADEAFDLLRAELASLGEDLDLLDQAIQEAREAPKGQWHWSGLGPSGRISEIEKRNEDGSAGSEVVAIYRALWKLLSSSAHPSPGWHRLKIAEQADGTLSFPESATGGDAPADQVAEKARNMLEMCRGLIALYRKMDDAEDG